MRRGRSAAGRIGALGLVVVGLGAGCSPVGIAVDDDVGIKAEEDLPIRFEDVMPVEMVSEVPISFEEIPPVRIERPVPVTLGEQVPVTVRETVPVTLAGPITLNVNLGDAASEGTYISEELFGLVELGATTIEWTEAVFGPPTRRTELGDRSEILVWRYRPMFAPGVFLSLRGDGPEEPAPTPILVFIRFVDGVAADKWRG